MGGNNLKNVRNWHSFSRKNNTLNEISSGLTLWTCFPFMFDLSIMLKLCWHLGIWGRQLRMFFEIIAFTETKYGDASHRKCLPWRATACHSTHIWTFALLQRIQIPLIGCACPDMQSGSSAVEATLWNNLQCFFRPHPVCVHIFQRALLFSIRGQEPRLASWKSEEKILTDSLIGKAMHTKARY